MLPGKCMLAALLLMGAGVAAAEVYPSRPIRLVVPFTAGGTGDINARVVARELEQNARQPVIVDNRAGANGVIGVEIVARAAPDGYTLLHHTTAIAISESVYRNLPYDLFRDLAPVTVVARGSGFILIANNALPARNVGELVALAKMRPLLYGSVGIGNTTQLVMEMFSRAANIRMTHVPYKGGAQAITAVAGGEVQLVFLPPTVALPHIKGGRLKAIAFSGSTRLANLPEVPTVAESGLPGFHRDSGFNAWFAPARTSPRILATLADEVRRALGVPRVKEVFIAGGYEPVGNTPVEAKAYLRDQVKDYGEIVRAIGLEPN